MTTPIAHDSRVSRRVFLSQSAAVTAALILRPHGAAGAAAPEANEAVLDRARASIQQHRLGPFTVRVLGADGRPVAGARVRIEQTRHHFLFGCNFFRFGRLQDPGLEEAYRSRFAALLNYATLGFYWASYERERGKPDYAYTDTVLAWCRDHGILCKGHPLAWDHPAGNPRWLPEHPDEIGRLSVGRVREIVGRFKGRLDYWDVVNEAVHLGQANLQTPMSRYARPLGARRYVLDHLKAAREANGGATLLVNDYRLDPPYFHLLQSLLDQNPKPFDVIGIQSHMHDHPWKLAQAWQHCETYARLGLPLHFTEATVVSGPRKGPGENWGDTTPELEARQADYVAKFYTVLFGHPAVQAITWWDFSDNGAWQRAAAGFVRKDMSPKPVYDRLMDLVKRQWWTRIEVRTDDKGACSGQAFYGDYRVRVDLPAGGSVVKNTTWKPGAPNTLEIRV